MRRNGWIATVLLLGTLAAAVGVGGCMRLPAFTQAVWSRWAEVGPRGVVQTLRLERGTLTGVAVGLGCEGAGCAADLSLTDAEGRVVARARVGGSRLEDVTSPVRRPYRWVGLNVGAKDDTGTVALRVMPAPGSQGRLLVRASEWDVYPYGEASGVEGVADLSFRLYDEVAGFEGFERLMDRAADSRPGFLAWRGLYAALAGLASALGAGFLVLAAVYGLDVSGEPGQNSE